MLLLRCTYKTYLDCLLNVMHDYDDVISWKCQKICTRNIKPKKRGKVK